MEFEVFKEDRHFLSGQLYETGSGHGAVIRLGHLVAPTKA